MALHYPLTILHKWHTDVTFFKACKAYSRSCTIKHFQSCFSKSWGLPIPIQSENHDARSSCKDMRTDTQRFSGVFKNVRLPTMYYWRSPVSTFDGCVRAARLLVVKKSIIEKGLPSSSWLLNCMVCLLLWRRNLWIRLTFRPSKPSLWLWCRLHEDPKQIPSQRRRDSSRLSFIFYFCVTQSR